MRKHTVIYLFIYACIKTEYVGRFVCIRVCAGVHRLCFVLRVIISNGEIKGLQTGSVIQLSISWLISTHRRRMREGLRCTAHGEEGGDGACVCVWERVEG